MNRIVIMGGTSGIGLHLAEAYASMGWKVGVAGRKEAPMKELKEMFPQQVEWLKIDVTKNDAPQRLLELIRNLGGMDVYLHTAGIGYENDSLDVEKDVATAETNVVGYTRMVDTAYRFFRKMSEKGIGGHIAVISSVAGTKGIGKLASYSASKKYQSTYLEALEQLAHTEGVDLAFTDIRPGWVRTPLLEDDRIYPMTMDEEKVVPLIIKAIKRRSRIAVVDWRWAVAVAFWRLIPGFLWVRIPLTISREATPEQTEIDAELANE